MDHRAPVHALRAPRTSGEALVAPPYDEVDALLAANARLPLSQAQLLGRSLADLATDARARLVPLALDYTRSYRDANPVADPRYLILAGHQPELFHAGVWFKNFLLSSLARRHQAVAVNLVVDSDICKQSSIRVPTGDAEQPIVEMIPLDAPADIVPWEQRPICDRSTFSSFARRVTTSIAGLVAEPLVGELWAHAEAAAGRGARLGHALAQARHAYEGQLGLETLELPLSAVCGTREFHWFVLWLLDSATRVREIYNRAVQDYRRVNHMRSAAHPVPDLIVEGTAVEVPLRVWTAADPQRRRLFVEREGARLVLTDRAHWRYAIHLTSSSISDAAEELATLEAQGVKIRPRALITTLYSRLVLGDLFVHGIGGAKYDEVTDRIIADLFGIGPPGYLTATATVHLPVPHATGAAAALSATRRRIRDLRYHPEALEASPDDEAWRAARQAKQRLVVDYRSLASRGEKDFARSAALHEQMATANAALDPWATPALQLLAERQTSLTEQVRIEAILESREYSFALYPREMLVPKLTALAEPAAVVIS
jgi:hypothetical protein